MVQVAIRSLAQGGAGFGTSGVRGTVEALTDRVCFAYTAAFLQAVVQREASRGGDRVVAVGHDLRPSSPRMVAACIAACQAHGTRVVLCQLVPWQFGDPARLGLRRTYRRTAFLVNRLLANLGAAGSTPILDWFRTPAGVEEKRWLAGLYLDAPEEWDDPYRFFRW